MKERKLILFVAVFLLLTSTMLVRADLYNEASVQTEVKKDKGKSPHTDSDADSEDYTISSSENSENDFEIEGDKLIRYTGKAEKVIVLDGIRVVGARAFKGNSYVKELILSDSVEYAESEAFAFMDNLEIIERSPFFYTKDIDVYDGSDNIKHFIVRNNFY